MTKIESLLFQCILCGRTLVFVSLSLPLPHILSLHLFLSSHLVEGEHEDIVAIDFKVVELNHSPQIAQLT